MSSFGSANPSAGSRWWRKCSTLTRGFGSRLVHERLRIVPRVRGDNMAVADQLIFVDQQAFHPHRAASVRLIGADADFGAEAVAKTVGKASGSVPVDPGGIHFIQEPPCVRLVF